jgi:hypothetical protein
LLLLKFTLLLEVLLRRSLVNEFGRLAENSFVFPAGFTEILLLQTGFFAVLACQIENVVILYCSIVKMGKYLCP